MDPSRLREETPGTAHCNHLNNAGAALMPKPVVRALHEHIDLEATVGGYEARAVRSEEIAGVYSSLGALIGGESHNIAVMENATAAFNQALSAIPFEAGDVLLTTRNDYASNQIAYLSLQNRVGVRIERAPDRPEGGVDPMAMAELIHKLRPSLVAVTHVPTNSGLVQPVEAIGEVCSAERVPYLVDACQSAGQIPLDVQRIQCDFLSATARKYLRGPRGIGFLFVSDSALDKGWEPLFPDMRGADWIADELYQPVPDARRFENWEFPYALVLGMGAAVDYALEVGIEPGGRRASNLASQARRELADIPEVRVLDRGEVLCAIVTIEIEGLDPETAVRRLRKLGINTAASPREVAVIDYDEKGVGGALRVSPHYYNTEEEITAAVEAIGKLAGEKRE